MPGGVDLHTHTTASDGTYAPRELVAEAASRGVRVLAITDHDSTEGLPEAFEEAERRRPLEVLPGIEINCDVEGAEIHVLGYLMDWQAEWFQDFCREQRRERRARSPSQEPAACEQCRYPERIRILPGGGLIDRPPRVLEAQLAGPENLAEIEPDGPPGDETALDHAEVKLPALGADERALDPGGE